jgi:hypothetical protein
MACAIAGSHRLYGHSDADLFLSVARSPFGTGAHFPGDHLAQGVAYRYGRSFFPFCGWILGLGQRQWIVWSLAVVLVASVALWFATTAEHLRRAGREPRLAWLLMLTPFGLVWASSPIVMSEPLACGLLLLTYLYASDHSRGRTIATAALTILTREALAIAFIPLAWQAWRARGRRGLLEWALAGVPYALWSTWVRVRVGHFPFLDPATTRRYAVALPFAGWNYTLQHPMQQGQAYGLLIGAVTIGLAIFVAVRTRFQGVIVQGAVVTSAFIACYGWAVWQFPSEAVRVMVPVHTLLLIALLSTNRDQRPVTARATSAQRTRTSGRRSHEAVAK